VISPRDEEGFSSCSACPCHRAVASTPLARIKTELIKLGPILDLEVVRDLQGSTTEGAVTAGAERSSTAGAQGLKRAGRAGRRCRPLWEAGPREDALRRTSGHIGLPLDGQGGGLGALGKPVRLRSRLARADARTSTLWASIRIKSFPS
jgi:hypothetical protein